MTRQSTPHAIRNRLLLSLGVTTVLGVFLTAFIFGVAASTIQTLAQRRIEMNALQGAEQRFEIAVFTQETFIFDYALSGREAALQEFQAATEAAFLAHADLREAAAPYPNIMLEIDAANDAAIRWRVNWAEPYLRTVGTDAVTSGASTVAGSEVLFGPLEQRIEELEAALAARRDLNAADIQSAIPNLALIVVPFGALMVFLLVFLGVWLTRTISGPLVRLNRTAEALVAGEAIEFHAERADEVGALADILERLRTDVGARYEEARREGEHATTFNNLAELTSFASNEQQLVEAAVHALWRLIPETAGDILLANASKNRLTVGMAWGKDAAEAGTIVQVDRIDRCPGIRRSSAFIADDVGDDMAVRCPAHPAETGSVACVPMSALGELVGVIHIEIAQAGALDAEMLRLVTRVAETVGLSIANARLMKTMEGQAMSDSLTGLRNARFFDPYLEQELQAAERDNEALSVIMLDIDHFKEFNDTHGHPAGDEALRTFAHVLGASIRSSDVAARYGGEEFIIALRHAGLEEAREVAEKIRAAVEQMVIELGPGRYGRVTTSMGVASTDMHVRDMKALVSLADAALYRAKELGRNRVEISPAIEAVASLAGPRRHRRIRPVTDEEPPTLATPA
jgi:diguanylate cyclase (GGDEF)-like protein